MASWSYPWMLPCADPYRLGGLVVTLAQLSLSTRTASTLILPWHGRG